MYLCKCFKDILYIGYNFNAAIRLKFSFKIFSFFILLDFYIKIKY